MDQEYEVRENNSHYDDIPDLNDCPTAELVESNIENDIENILVGYTQIPHKTNIILKNITFDDFWVAVPMERIDFSIDITFDDGGTTSSITFRTNFLFVKILNLSYVIENDILYMPLFLLLRHKGKFFKQLVIYLSISGANLFIDTDNIEYGDRINILYPEPLLDSYDDDDNIGDDYYFESDINYLSYGEYFIIYTEEEIYSVKITSYVRCGPDITFEYDLNNMQEFSSLGKNVYICSMAQSDRSFHDFLREPVQEFDGDIYGMPKVCINGELAEFTDQITDKYYIRVIA